MDDFVDVIVKLFYVPFSKGQLREHFRVANLQIIDSKLR